MAQFKIRILILISILLTGLLFIPLRAKESGSSIGAATSSHTISNPLILTPIPQQNSGSSSQLENVKKSATEPQVAPVPSQRPTPPYWSAGIIYNEPRPHPINNPDEMKAIVDIQKRFTWFRSRMPEMPKGDNAAIVRQLRGENKEKMNFFEGVEIRLNEKEELIDQWGTPYFFHYVSSYYMQVRSAGPDKKLWTADDDFS